MGQPVALLSAPAAMSSNWDGQRKYQGAEQNAQAAANAQAAQQGEADFAGVERGLRAVQNAVCVLVGPLPDGEVKTALRGMLVEAVSARLQARRSELKQNLLDAAAAFAR